MDACCAVEREVDKVLSKFGSINEHADRVLQELITYIENLKKELDNGECTFITQSPCDVDYTLQTKDIHVLTLCFYTTIYKYN